MCACQISDVLSRRLVSITGPEGIGKTTVATAVAHYLAVRQRFPGGVYFVHLKVSRIVWMSGGYGCVGGCRGAVRERFESTRAL